MQASSGAEIPGANCPGNSVGWRNFPPGARVVVRQQVLSAYDLAPGSGGALRPRYRFKDVIGIVLAVTSQGLTLRRDAAGYRDRAEVFVPTGTIYSAKIVPPRPARHSE